MTMMNIGKQAAKNAKVTYFSPEEGIVPAEMNNIVLFQNINASAKVKASFSFMVTDEAAFGRAHDHRFPSLIAMLTEWSIPYQGIF